MVFILFNIYGLATNGFGYIKHLTGPAWYLAPPVFCIELVSLCVRPITLLTCVYIGLATAHEEH